MRIRFGRGLLAALTLALAAAAGAAPPAPLKTQVPGYYRHAIGDVEVTALYDGFVDLDTQLLKGMNATEVQRLMARMFIATQKGVQTAVNAYLVHLGDHLVLIDTGSSTCFGPTVGRVVENLKAGGYTPEAVDTVLLTHMHPDHQCGLLTADGRVAFPNATVWAAQEDIDHWLSEAVAAAQPESVRPFYKMARDAAAPYQAAGKLRGFKAGEALLEGRITAVPTHGHTPGHTAYRIDSKGQSLLVWGDIVHYHAVQFAHPETSFEYDSDAKQAVATRKALFAQAAQGGWWVAGAHLPFPGLGHVRRDPAGYAWVPVEFGPIRSDR